MATLRLVPQTGAPLEITEDRATVGRDPVCELVVADGSISRRHATLERRGTAWYVVDLGSANGTTRPLLANVRPAYAVISVGRGNPYGHPHRPTLKRLKAFARRIARTDKNGDVTIRTDGRAISLTTDR